MSAPSGEPSGPVHGSSTITPVGKRGTPVWMWLLPLLLLLGVLIFALRSCRHHDDPVPTTAEGSAQTPPVGVKKIVLPGGTSLDLDPSSLNYQLQEYLASTAPAPRTFVFDHLNFATGSSALPTDAQTTVDALAQIMKAYPAAKVRLDGYADSTGSEPANVQLGARRAESVAAALVADGIPAERVTTATGGESHPVDTNATAAGRAANRRTELVVLTK